MIDDYVRKAKCLRVVDADTLEMLVDLGFRTYVQLTVRLADIDCWEPRHSDPDHAEKGRAASAEVTRWMAPYMGRLGNLGPPWLRLTSREWEQGKYGRAICDIDMDGVSLARALRQAGHEKKR